MGLGLGLRTCSLYSMVSALVIVSALVRVRVRVRVRARARVRVRVRVRVVRVSSLFYQALLGSNSKLARSQDHIQEITLRV